MRIGPTLASALQAGVVLAATGALGLAAHQPWLFPSLAPTAILQAQPRPAPTARPWNAAVGHGCGVVFGCVGVLLAGARHAPGVMASGQLSVPRLLAAIVAVVLTTVGSELARARHAPAGSTTLLFAEGSYRVTWHDVGLVAVGIVLTVVLGEALARLRTARAARARESGVLAQRVPRGYPARGVRTTSRS